MSRETDFRSRMIADTTLMAALTGGVYTVDTIGRDGISRDTAPGAFGTDGYLKPCALVRQRGLVADSQVVDQSIASGQQVIEIYLYQDNGYSSIDTALARLFVLFNQHQFTNTFPAEWINTLDREQDSGSLKGASLARQEWLIALIQGA